ncbi:unnamed protein product [Enterobius vermicularis]|uniref:acid phosphatase n=1 Tax=Enterobius vermicularis TaxID=51028 RepID=A0A0N4VAV7_ENTVE|nr:unnamed protein product [Enterobius vermicularis]
MYLPVLCILVFPVFFTVYGQDDLPNLVAVVWTNGERNPTYVCKNDKNVESTWIQGYGALTKKGMSQHAAIGDTIYKSYLPKNAKYHSNSVYFRSSDDSAAIASAYANLIGIYYRRSHQSGKDYPSVTGWPQDFVPVPVHGAEPTTDYELNGGSNCKLYQSVVDKIVQSDEYANFTVKNNATITDISDVCGDEITPFDLWKLEEASNAENSMNRTNLFTPEQQKMIHDMYVDFEAIKYKVDQWKLEMASARGGNLLWHIVQNMITKSNCTKDNWPLGHICHWMNPLRLYAYSTDMVMARSLVANFDDKTIYNTTFSSSNPFVLAFALFNNSGRWEFEVVREAAAD